MINDSYMANGYNPFDDELKHWKYIKKVKKNGKWHYIYDTSELSKYENNVEESKPNDTGGTTTTHYSQTNKLFNTEMVADFISDGSRDTEIWKSQGKLSRSYAKGEKWLYDNVFNRPSKNKRDTSSASKRTARGKKFVEDLMKR